MTDSRGNAFTRLFRGIGRLLNGLRIVVLNLVFFFLLFLVIGVLVDDRKLSVDDGIALVVAPRGEIVEQYSGSPVERAIADALGDEEPEARMRDLTLAINQAADDERIKALVLDTRELWSAGLAQLQAVGRAVDRFRDSGKPVFAYGDYFDQRQYYLAARANEVMMHPDGLVFMEGLSRYRTYLKEGLDKLAMDVHLFRVGEYKSAGEPFVRNDMSPAAKEANRAWLGELWSSYVADVSAARNMDEVLINDYIERFGARLQSVGGQASEAAMEAGLIDELVTRDQFRDRLIELVGEDEDSHSFRQIGYEGYADAVRLTRLGRPDDKVAVVVAQGPIVDGDQPQGTIGAESTARLLRDARFDEQVKAVVLRVDSGGGSAFASEVIRREIELTRQAGKPVVVSMGSVAASGGYWISMSADRIFAEPTTITGSIGVFGLFLNYPRTLDKIGVNVDGVGTTKLAGAFHPGRALDPEVGNVVQQLVEQTYQDFVEHVAQTRDLPESQVRDIAQGRVWSGQRARELGLVDEFGGVEEAEAAAAKLAEISEYRTVYLEKKLSPFEQWVVDASGGAMALAGIEMGPGLADLPLIGGMYEEVRRFVGRQADPRGLYAYCFCRLPKD